MDKLLKFVVIGLVTVQVNSQTSSSSSGVPIFGRFFLRITNQTFGAVRNGINVINSTLSNILNRVGSASDKIRDILEEFRKSMMKGIPELGIPILEPLTIDRIDLNVSHEIANLEGFLERIKITHLSKFKLDYVHFSLSNVLTLNLTFPQIDVTGYYDVNGKIGEMFHIYGKGPFWLRLYNLSIGTVSQIRYGSNREKVGYYVESMRIYVKLGKLRNRFQNLMKDDETGEVFNKAISQLAPEALNILWPEFEPIIARQVVNIINNKFTDFELGNLFRNFINAFKLNLNQARINVHN